MAKSLLWLASYPKSGNTWMRAFLANYIFDPDQPVPINQISKIGISDTRIEFYRRFVRAGANLADPRQMVEARDRMLHALDANGADLNFVKTHNRNVRAFGFDLAPPHLTRGAIYIVRDPRDMVISYASHHGADLDEAIARLNHPDNATGADAGNVHQFHGTWSEHVKGWTSARGFPVHAVRYEDMLQRPEQTFRKIVRFLRLDLDKTRLAKAIDFSSFQQLKAQEEKSGFIENPGHQDAFFRTGKAGGWKEVLTPEQALRIETDHRRVMRRHGYLD